MSPTAHVVYWDEDLRTGRLTWTESRPALGPERAPPQPTRTWWTGHVHPDDRSAVGAALDELRAGRRTHWQADYRARSGASWRTVHEQVVLVEQDGAPRRMVGTIRDVHRGPAPVPVERRFAALADQLSLLAWEADADGWVDFFNQRWLDYTGTTFEEVEGWGWVRVHDPDDLPRTLRVFRDGLASGEPWETALRLRRGSDGMLRWHLSRAFPLRDAQGRIVRWFGTSTDIHEQRIAADERERLLEEERRLRLEAEAASREKDDFLDWVSHELRTPLSVVLLWVQLLAERPGDRDWLARGLFKIEHNVRQLGRLLEDLLDTSRIIGNRVEIEHEPIDLALPARRAIDALAGDAATRGVYVRLEVGAEPAVVLGSTVRLEQVVTNLVASGIRSSEEGAVVHVTVARAGDEAVLEVRDQRQDADDVVLAERGELLRQDEGPARRPRGGLALGMSVARHLVLLHGGSIQAERAGHGPGVVIRVRLPCAGEAVGEPAVPRRAVDEGTSLAGIRVLAVDDDADAREVLTVVLASCEATVTVARSVSQALELLRGGLPDVVVTDLAMPDVDGYHLLERLRASQDEDVRAIPVVALTAHASAKDEAAALSAGFAAYVAKPFDAATLSQVIARVVRERAAAGDRAEQRERR